VVCVVCGGRDIIIAFGDGLTDCISVAHPQTPQVSSVVCRCPHPLPLIRRASPCPHQSRTADRVSFVAPPAVLHQSMGSSWSSADPTAPSPSSVGVFECRVYEDGRGGYEMDVQGQRVAIDRSFHDHIKFGSADTDTSSVGSKRRRREDHNEPPPPAAGCPQCGATHEAPGRFACGICKEGATEPVVTRCGHMYCWACLGKWLLEEDQTSCPVCKAGVTVDSLIPIYGTAGGNQQDPRLRGIPQRPTAERTPNSHSVASGGGAPVGTSAAGTAGPQPSGTQQQRASDSEGFTVTPLGARYRIITPGTGRVPTANDRVKVDTIAWRDAFDGRDKAYDVRGWVRRVSDFGYELLREAVLSMREGETRQIIAGPRYIQLRLISIE